MGEHSIEHSLAFNVARRALRFVAPEYRAMATDQLQPGQSVLDLSRKTVEVPEGDAYAAAGMILFHAGFIREMDPDPEFGSIAAGNPYVLHSMRDEQAVRHAADSHARVDQLAYRWAWRAMALLYPELGQEEAQALSDQRQTFEAWHSYFSS